MWGTHWILGPISVLALVLSGCGGSTPPPEEPEAEPPPVEEPPPKPAPIAEEESESEPPPPPATPTKEPEFTENMSVNDALNAVPQDSETKNIDTETLGKPLSNLEVYESCKPGAARVKLRVAVWNGKAVGVDANVTPPNERLANCIKDKVRGLTWEKKVKSLNTIEYQF